MNAREIMEPRGYAKGCDGTGWERRVGAVVIEVKHLSYDAHDDPRDPDWIALAHADDGSFIHLIDAGPLDAIADAAIDLPTDPALFKAFVAAGWRWRMAFSA